MWIVVLVAAVAGGTRLAGLWDDASPLGRLSSGAPLGLALLGLVGFVCASILGLGAPSVGVAALAVASLVLLPARRPPARPRRGRWLGRLALLGLTLAAAASVFDRAMFTRPDGIYTGVDHNLGDLPFHIAVITGFAKGGNLPPEHPELAGARLTYPFLVDFVAALLMRAGASLRQALLAENLVLAAALALLLHRWGLRLTRDARAALLVPVLVFLSGGLGFLLLFGEARRAGLLALLARLPHDYTITRTGELRWGNVVTTLLMPQRALLLGAPLAVLVWMLWWRALVEPAGERLRVRLMLAAGGVTGLLPLAHAHAFAVALAMGACMALLFPRRQAWAAFFACALLLAAPQALWLALSSSMRAGSFVAWQPGWDSGGRNPVLFWVMNAGLFLPVLLVALLRSRPRRLVRFSLPFLLLFVAPNLWRLSPWIWDNIKFLFFWHVASVPLVALLLARLWRAGRAVRAGAAALVLCLTLSGALDVWRVGSRQIAHRLYGAADVALASEVLETTPPRALILHAPTYDSPVYLSGRRSLLGYLGHIPSQGLDAGNREQEIERIYAGAPDADALLARYGVDYVLVGPQEQSRSRVDDAFLGRFPLAAERGPYRLYRVER